VNWLESESALESLVRQFEFGQLEEGQWHHREHLAICYWYLCHKSLIEATYRMKLGILKYNEKYQVEQTPSRGYHETITQFFIKFLHSYVGKNPGRGVDGLNDLLRQTNGFLPHIGQYFSRPLLNSERARLQWVEPDLQALP